MLITQPKRKIVAKYLKTPRGDTVCGYFLVIEFEGQIFWKLLKVEDVEKTKIPDSNKKNKIVYLPNHNPKPVLHVTSYMLHGTPSPYFHPEFLTSVKIRAPSSGF